MRKNEILDKLELFNDLMDEAYILRSAYGVVNNSAMVLNSIKEETNIIDIVMKEEYFDRMCSDLFLAPKLYKNQKDHWYMRFYGCINVFKGWETGCCTKPKYNLVHGTVYVQTPESVLEEKKAWYKAGDIADIDLLKGYINRADEDNIHCAEEEIDFIISYYDESEYENKKEYINFLVSQIFLILYSFKNRGDLNNKEMGIVMDYVSEKQELMDCISMLREVNRIKES